MPRFLNLFQVNVLLQYPLKTWETRGFLLFSGDTEMKNWYKIGYCTVKPYHKSKAQYLKKHIWYQNKNVHISCTTSSVSYLKISDSWTFPLNKKLFHTNLIFHIFCVIILLPSDFIDSEPLCHPIDLLQASTTVIKAKTLFVNVITKLGSNIENWTKLWLCNNCCSRTLSC